MALVLSGSIDISGSMTATTIIVSSPGVAGMVSSSAQITELAPLMTYTASLKGAIEVSGQNVNVLGMITAQQFNVTYVSSSVMYQSGSTKFGDDTGDKHAFTGSLNVSGGLVDIAKDGQSIRIWAQNSANSSRIQLQSSGSNGLLGANSIIAIEGKDGAENFLYSQPFSMAIGTATQKALHLAANSNVVMTITGSNVAIGTVNPLGKLDVYRAAGLSGTAAIVISNGEAGGGRNWSLSTEVINEGDFAICQSTTNGGTPAPIAANTKLYINGGGFLKASNNGTFYDSTANYHEIKSTVSDNTMIMWNSSATPSGLFINYTSSPNNTASQFLRCFDGNVGTERASIRSNGGLVNYQTNDVNLSDERTKKDIIPLESYWDKFKAIEIVKFKYKDQTHDDFNIGVIAQQVESIAPEFVDVDGFGKTPEDGIPLKSIYTADLHHATIKVLQEAMAKIEELTARIEALENK